jgi:hypothetical protein
MIRRGWVRPARFRRAIWTVRHAYSLDWYHAN